MGGCCAHMRTTCVQNSYNADTMQIQHTYTYIQPIRTYTYNVNSAPKTMLLSAHSLSPLYHTTTNTLMSPLHHYQHTPVTTPPLPTHSCHHSTTLLPTHSCYQAALVEFSSFSIKEGSTVNTYGQFVVKDVAWDDQCGGEDLELALVNHLVKEFEGKHGVDLHASPRAIAKLRKQVCLWGKHKWEMPVPASSMNTNNMHQ